MEIPCGHIGQHIADCHFCTLSATDSRYAVLWDRLKESPRLTSPRDIVLRMKSPCVRLGEVIEQSKSCGCPPVYNCSRFGRVIKIGSHKEGLRSCSSCANYELKPLAIDASSPDPLSEPDGARNQGFAKEADIIKTHLSALKIMSERTYEAPPLKGRGVVLCGGGKYWPGIVVAAKLLAKLSPDLPIQVWYRGNDEPVDAADIAGMSNITLVNAYEVAVKHPCRILRGWESKLFALKHCGFETALYLDADAYCVADPTPLLELAEKESFVFWSDLAGNYKTVKWPEVWPQGDAGIPAIQGGQLAMHLPSIWKEIELAHWMNQHSDFYYQHMYGDQDTWRVAFAITGKPVKCLGPAPWDSIAFVCPLNNKPLIVHRCQGKLFKPVDIPKGNHAYSNPKWHLPLEEEVFSLFSSVLRKEQDPAKVFADIYARDLWNGGSGSGSSDVQSAPYVSYIKDYIKEHHITSVVDLGCGDGRVALKLYDGSFSYTGVDVVKTKIDSLKVKHHKLDWIHADFFAEIESMPSGDLLLCKDVLHHWPTHMITKFLSSIKESKKWNHILFTQDHGQQSDNQDTYLGGFRGLDPSMAPMNALGTLVHRYGYKSICTLA